MPAMETTNPEDPTRQPGEGSRPPALERVGVAAVATVIPSLLLVHAVAALLHRGPGISPGAVAATWTVVAVALVHAVVEWRRPRGFPRYRIVVPVAAALLLAVVTRSVAVSVSVAVCCGLQGWAQARVAGGLPATVDGLLGRRRWRALGWSLLALLAVVQTGRLAAHEADPEVAWWVTSSHPAWADHQCVSAYVYAADLHDQGQANIYAGEHYPPFEDENAKPRTTVENLERHLECSYEYPPPFLVLPLALLRITDDFHVIRPIWFALNGLGFLALAVLLGLWVGGPRGHLALWLLPAVWCAVPTLQTFQFGQFHLSAFALALGGMLAFERRMPVLGGALLGAAVVAKIFPGVLLLLLASQRRWRELLTTSIWILVFGAGSLAVLGIAPFQAFLSTKLPSMLDGSAFIGPGDEPALVGLLTGITAVPWRLQILGLPSLPAWLGPWMGHALGLGILALVWRAGRRATDRAQAPVLWLALLNLFVLQGPTAFCDYTTATHLWLLSFVAVDMARSRTLAIVSWITWIHLATLLGTFPIPDDPTGEWPGVLDVKLLAASTLLMTALALGINLWSALRATTDRRDTASDTGPALR